MKNFNNSWRNFLNEGSRTENVPFEDTRIRIKLENKGISLNEVTEDEFEHIQTAIDELGPEDLPFHDIFGDKTRLIVDFPTADESSELGIFINMWKLMGYEVDWTKGMVSSERTLKNSSPEAMAKELTGGGFGGMPTTKRKINMKIGKWLAKVYEYMVKKEKLLLKVKEHMRKEWEDEVSRSIGGPPSRITGNDIQDALGENDTKNYYRLGDYIDMMTRYMAHGLGSMSMGSYPGVNEPDKVKTFMRYWQENAGYIKKHIDDVTSDQYSIVVTRDPIDVWRMSDFDNIESCHSPPSRGGGGEYYKCAVAEAHGHGAVAYVVKTDELMQGTETNNIESAEAAIQDGEIFADDMRRSGGGIDLQPISRIRLRQVRYYTHNEEAALLAKYGTIGDLPDDLPEEEMRALIARIRRAKDSAFNPYDGVQLAVPEKRIYGSSIPGLHNRILKWARETQEEQMERAPRYEDGMELNLSDFIKFGGTHDDNPMSVLLPELFGDDITGARGHVKTDTTTEDDLDADLVAGLLQRYQAEVNSLDEEWNNRMRWTMVDGDVIDDGGGGVYITCGAKTYAEWDADDWNSMPSVKIIGYVLDELKEYGMGWVRSDYPWQIQKTNGTWRLPIAVSPEHLTGFGGQEYAYEPDNYEEFCSIVDDEVDEKHEAIQFILTNFFKREGFMDGGAVMVLGRNVINDDIDLYHWEAEAEEGYEMDEYEFIQFTAHPEVWYDDFNATEEQAMKIMNDRNFWLEIRRRMAAPAFENTGGQMYPQMPLDMNMFGIDGTEGKSQELNLYFSVYGDDPDEQVKVLEELVSLWDDQDEINRVANEVFRDMLAGNVGMDGTPVGDPYSGGVEAPVRESYEREELNILRVERMLAKL